MSIAITKIDKQIKFLKWEEIMGETIQQIAIKTRLKETFQKDNSLLLQPEYINSHAVYPSGHKSAGQYISLPDNRKTATIVKNEVSLNYYKSTIGVGLKQVSKGIIIGTEENYKNVSLFETSENLMVGDRFWVTLKGEFQANFFYYDQVQGTWNDPMGKGIIVGSTDINNTTANLPSNNLNFVCFQCNLT